MSDLKQLRNSVAAALRGEDREAVASALGLSQEEAERFDTSPATRGARAALATEAEAEEAE